MRKAGWWENETGRADSAGVDRASRNRARDGERMPRSPSIAAIAYHEAGHAVVGWQFGCWLRNDIRIFVRGVAGCLGVTPYRNDIVMPGQGLAYEGDALLMELLWKSVEIDFMIRLAGPLAETG